MKKLLTLLLLCPALAAPALAGDLALKGYFKTYLYSLEPVEVRNYPLPQPAGAHAVIENKFRLKTYWDLGAGLRAEGAYELVFTAKKAELAAARPVSGGNGYRVSDPDPFLSPSSGGETKASTLIQNLDRAFITWSPAAFDLYAGRQPLAFGSGRTANPTDILAPYPYGTIDTEERRGVDALRAKVPRGEMGELDAGWLPGKNWSAGSGAGFLRGKGIFSDTDITLISALFRGNLMAGADIERHLGGAMLRAEAAQVWAGTFQERSQGDDFFRLTAGAEYNFGLLGGTDAWLEYHYNGAGAAGAEGYAARAARTAYTEANVSLLGRHYLSAGAAAQLSALVSASAGVLVNLHDRSFYALPSLEWNAAEDLYLSAGALLPSGQRASFNGLSAVPSSEFGLYDRAFYAALRKYF
ncbi:MAG: hypothetical protein COT18_08580 [Elusimicrobia bacterium CG08_land_8_20_14_0_20_59_10]|nr:MAG: hypothetical protein COT18_08580 [Elusimicrobia bacterium CG08_land_8_20_14_0_20_59_10]